MMRWSSVISFNKCAAIFIERGGMCVKLVSSVSHHERGWEAAVISAFWSFRLQDNVEVLSTFIDMQYREAFIDDSGLVNLTK